MRTSFIYSIVALALAIVVSSLFIFNGCENKQDSNASPAYKAEINSWHGKRVKRLTSKTGWLTLAGLYWLTEGENTFGSSGDNQIKFPVGKAPEFIGSYFLEKENLRVEINPDVNVLHGGKRVTSMTVLPDISGRPTTLSLDSLSWFIIKRGDKFGIRLKDRGSKFLKEFSGIETFPIDSTWRVEARLDPYKPPKMIDVPDIIGTVNKSRSPGALVFSIKGKEYRLDPLGDSSARPLFLIFADQTNGIETYGAGRFFLFHRRIVWGIRFIDFNKAYNPPCAFTAYATCPLPPSQNVLPLEVKAGEKNYGHH